jgi:hypothetical protein
MRRLLAAVFVILALFAVSNVYAGELPVTKCTVTAGKTEGYDTIVVSGEMNATADDLSGADNIQVTVDSNDMNTFVQTFPRDANTYKNGKYKCSKTENSSKTSFTFDTKTSKFSFTAKNVDLSGLSCPLTVRIEIGGYTAEAEVDEAIVNGPKSPISIKLMMGIKNVLRVDSYKVTQGKKFNSDQLTVKGGFAVEDTDVDMVDRASEDLVITLGTQHFTIPANNLKVGKGTFSCSNAKITGGTASATFNFNTCSFTITIKNAEIEADAGAADFGLEFYGFNFPGPTVLESASQTIPAAEGGTVSLPSGTSVTIQPGALTEDQTMTLTLFSALPTQPPGGLIVGAGPALTISTKPAALSVHATKIVSSRVSEQLGAQAADSTQLVLNIGTNSIIGAADSVAMIDVVDLSGGDNFIGIPAQLNNNVATASLPAALFENSREVRFSLAKLRPAVELQPLPSPGAAMWSPSASSWIDGTPGFDCSKRTLVVVHGMTSQVQEAFPKDTVEQIMAAGEYQQVVGFNYNWTQGITNSGSQLAAFLGSLKAACPDIQVDIEAHSEGVPVALSAACQTTNMPIGHIVMLGGPIMGTPAALLAVSLQLQLKGLNGAQLSIPTIAHALTTTLLNLPDTYAAPVSTLNDILSGQFAPDLLPGSDALAQIRACVCAKMTNTTSNLASTKLIAMAGTDYSNCGILTPLGSVISTLFGGGPLDGIVGESSALAVGSCFDDSRITRHSYPICHTALESDQNVIQEVGQEVRIDCSFGIDPAGAAVDFDGGGGTVSVTTSNGCDWTVFSNNSWITIDSGSSGSGNGTVEYSVEANSGAANRTGTLTIAGKTFTVTQAGGGVTGTWEGTLNMPGSSYTGCEPQTISFSLSLNEDASMNITGYTSNDRTISSGSRSGNSIMVTLSTMFGSRGPYMWEWNGTNTITGSMAYFCYDLSTGALLGEGIETFTVTRY